MSFRQQALSVIAVTLATLALVRPSAADEKAEPAEDDGNNKTPVVRVQTITFDAAGGVAVVFQAGPGNSYGAYQIREDVDPQDGVERFALLLPAGPLIVEATMTLDGKPFRAAREALIDEMLTEGDTDGDGTVTWDEALQNVRFTYGRIFPEQQRAQYLKMLDRDEDGEVDRAEARGFLAVTFQGPAFQVSGGFAGGMRGLVVFAANGALAGSGGSAGPDSVWSLLDADGDGVLSETEIAGAGERLKSRDADDNDLLYTNELAGAPNPGPRRQRVNAANGRQPYVVPQQPFVLLGPTARADALFAAVKGQYQTEDGNVERSSFSNAAELFDQLDANDDQLLSEDEVLALNDVEPQVRLTVDLGREQGESTLSLTSVAGGRKLPDATDSSAGVELPGVAVTFEVNTAATVNLDYAQAAQRMLDQYDGDKNEYLELSELPQNFAQQFAAWDGDSDGKVFKQDIVEGYTRAQVPQQTQIQASVTRSGDPLFPALDLSGDSRLSLREMKTAEVQLSALDADGDGRLTRIEVPDTYAVNFRIGNGGYRQYQVLAVGRGGFRQPAPPTGDGPAWFLRMDRNGDGDVTLKEFLGDREAFATIDTNSDGFIEPAEAKAASEPESDGDSN